MEHESSLHAETTAWCQRAEEAVQNPPVACRPPIELAREGVLLRRRWDRAAPESPDRRHLLRLLPAVQGIAQQRLSESVQSPSEGDANPSELVQSQLVEDDQYLAGLLNDRALSTESAALAIECFRDDLHWLAAQVAVLDGTRSVDFLGRLLLEQEALEREMNAWEQEATGRDGVASLASDDATLRAAARRLRNTALARQLESLVDQPEPNDGPGWYRRWQAASRLAMRLDPETAANGGAGDGEDQGRNPLPPDVRQVLGRIRANSSDRWRHGLDELPTEEAIDALHGTAGELADDANESLTFLEDLTLPGAVYSLEIIEEDLTTCLRCVEGRRTEELQKTRGLLRRRLKSVTAELQERRVTWRMERLFGHRFVARLERFILFLLVFFVIMLAIEAPLIDYEAARRGIPKHSGQGLVEPVFAWIDLGICMVFLAEFSLKMGLARRRGLYLKRNWLTGLLPAIPVGFLAYAANHPLLAKGGEWVVSLRALRYLRLPRLARWLRIARPVLRVARLVGFMLRASDRLVRQLTPVLNRNLVLFERGAIRVEQPPYRAKLAALHERFYYRAVERIHELPQAPRWRLARARIDDLSAMLASPGVGQAIPAVPVESAGAREIPLERIIARLLVATPAGISDRIGHNLAHSVTRWCRAFDMFAVRRLPVVRDLVAAGRLPSPYDTTARVANRLGLLLKHALDRVYWLADLYGTVTAPQLVDSMGETMVKGAARPARRLVLIGAAFLAVTYLFSWLSYWLPFLNLQAVSTTLRQLIGWPLVVLGCLCLVVFGLGVWFRRIAGEATDFYTQVAQAQFIAATKQLKHRLARRYGAVLERRVIGPEEAIAGSRASPGVDPDGEDGGMDQVEGARSAVKLLWHDYLDGAPFLPDDTRTTNQLLGNLVLVSLRETRLRYSRRQTKKLQRLDLGGNRMSMRGPYLWFHFISRSLAQHTAKLVVDYNACALPLSRAATANQRAIRRYVAWLSRRLQTPIDRLDLPAQFRRRWQAMPTTAHVDGPPDSRGRARRWSPDHAEKARRFEGNDFTAIHFLSADPEIEADIRRRYGDPVADLMRRDRRDNIRRVFRTYPFHHWPKEQRTLNPLTLYGRHLAGGRVLLLPLKTLWWAAALGVRAIRLVWTVVEDVLNPSVVGVSLLEDSDPFEVAVRKIHRMRKPLFLECLRMRAEFDPEYLGILLPGQEADGRVAAAVEIEDDLKTVDAEPSVRAEARRLATLRQRQIRDFRYWLDRLDIAGLPARSLRAMAVAYTIDYQGVRGRLEAARRVENAFAAAASGGSGERAQRGARRGSPDPADGSTEGLSGPRDFRSSGCGVGRPAHSAIRALWRHWRLGDRLDRLFRRPPSSGFDDDAPVQAARTLLLGVGRDPDPWSRQLVILRAVQTLSVLDLIAYRDLVAELGEYDTSTSPDPSLAGMK